ncbi:MAG TPA: hypothetical protein VMW34_07555 [Anaerolineales bacterium]|nr:hypothetical protein [Anaerolineales bacterium]
MTIINILLALLFSFYSTSAGFQEEQLQISLKRNWGYSSGTGRIQGTFTIRTSGPDDLAQVVYFLDDQVLGDTHEEPFNLQFNTDNFTLGAHQLRATGLTASNTELSSNIIQVEFVSADDSWQAATNIIVPLVVVILGALVLAIIILLIFTRGKKDLLPPGAPRKYGHYGGAICPKCSRPFSRHIYGLNLGLVKFDRCPYCGKWSLVRRASRDELEAAEAAEIGAAEEGFFSPYRSKEGDLRQEIEDSRFEDL